jgi:hypothetical protein
MERGADEARKRALTFAFVLAFQIAFLVFVGVMLTTL